MTCPLGQVRMELGCECEVPYPYASIGDTHMLKDLQSVVNGHTVRIVDKPQIQSFWLRPIDGVELKGVCVEYKGSCLSTLDLYARGLPFPDDLCVNVEQVQVYQDALLYPTGTV